MKFTLISIASLAGLALAQESCPAPVTVTITPTETVTCGGTVYTTVTQKTTITVPAGSAGAVVSSQPASSQAAAVSSAVVPGSSVAAVSSNKPLYLNTTTTNGFVSGTVSFQLPSSSIAAAEESSTSAQPTDVVVSTAYVVPVAASSAVDAVSSAVASSAAAAAVSSSAAVASTAASSSGSVSGQASFYGGNTNGGKCSFSTLTLPSGLFGTALSAQNWDGAGNCGACVEVTGPNGNSIKAMITDECPECALNKLDLYENAFTQLASASTGIIDIAWSVVPCGIATPLQLRNKEGTSAYWFSMQVVNANVAVSKLEVSTDGGSTWQATTRQDYNFFEESSGFGTESVDVRVTSKGGETVVVEGVSVAAGTSVTAGSNFSS